MITKTVSISQRKGNALYLDTLIDLSDAHYFLRLPNIRLIDVGSIFRTGMMVGS